MQDRFKNLIQTFANSFGYEIRRKRSQAEPRPKKPLRHSLLGALDHVAATGWKPETVIDIGAAYGSFTRECERRFPNAHYLLIEPLL